jgi:hypothetical protein
MAVQREIYGCLIIQLLNTYTRYCRVGLWCVRIRLLHMNTTLPDLLVEFALLLSFGAIHDHHFWYTILLCKQRQCFMGVNFLLQREGPYRTIHSAKDLRYGVPQPNLDIGVHGISKSCHEQTRVPHMPIIRDYPPVETWVDRRLHPPLRGHISRLLGRFNPYAQVLAQSSHVNTTIPRFCIDVQGVDISIQAHQMTPIIQNFFDSLQLCISVDVLGRHNDDLPIYRAYLASPWIQLRDFPQ